MFFFWSFFSTPKIKRNRVLKIFNWNSICCIQLTGGTEAHLINNNIGNVNSLWGSSWTGDKGAIWACSDQNTNNEMNEIEISDTGGGFGNCILRQDTVYNGPILQPLGTYIITRCNGDQFFDCNFILLPSASVEFHDCHSQAGSVPFIRANPMPGANGGPYGSIDLSEWSFFGQRENDAAPFIYCTNTGFALQPKQLPTVFSWPNWYGGNNPSALGQQIESVYNNQTNWTWVPATSDSAVISWSTNLTMLADGNLVTAPFNIPAGFVGPGDSLQLNYSLIVSNSDGSLNFNCYFGNPALMSFNPVPSGDTEIVCSSTIKCVNDNNYMLDNQYFRGVTPTTTLSSFTTNWLGGGSWESKPNPVLFWFASGHTANTVLIRATATRVK